MGKIEHLYNLAGRRLMPPAMQHSLTAQMQKSFSHPQASEITRKPYTTAHGGDIRPKLRHILKEADNDNHTLATLTSCQAPHCSTTNCADPNSPIPCAVATAQQNQQQIPPSGGPNNTSTNILGNMTSKIPKNKQGHTINTMQNYSQQSRPQKIVLEPGAPKIDPKEIQIDPTVTKYVQETSNHNAIMSAPNVQTLPNVVKK